MACFAYSSQHTTIIVSIVRALDHITNNKYSLFAAFVFRESLLESQSTMCNFSISFAVLLSVALLLSKTKLQVEADQCYFNFNCGLNKYCCKQRYWYQTNVCRLSCVGQSCRRNSDCGGPNECCNSTKLCTTSGCNECSSNGDCGKNKYCCKQRYIDQQHICGHGGCAGQSCNSDSDCGGPGECCSSSKYCSNSSCNECSSNSDCGYNKYCCKRRHTDQSNVCVYGSCVGQPCSLNSDCHGPGECCRSNYCTKSSCDECYSNSDCGLNKYCCKHRHWYQANVCLSSCVGQSCNSDSDCGGDCCSWRNYCIKSGCDKCFSNSDCGYNRYCCKQRYYYKQRVCGHGGCVGQSCYSDSDCGGPGECCNSTNYCTNSSCDKCFSNSDCGYNKYCCKERYTGHTNVCVYGGCVGQPCSLNSDCRGRGECCNSKKLCTTGNCDECSSNSNCSSNYYCCKHYKNHICGYGGCVGQSCNRDSDCGGQGECCSSSKYCTKLDCNECSSNSDCGYNQYCCKKEDHHQQRSVCRHGGCVGQPCSSDRNCGGPGECCNSTNYCTKSGCNECDCDNNYYCCKQLYVCGYYGCVGQPCNLDSDCGGPDECCRNNLCTNSAACFNDVAKGLASWIIAVIVVSVLAIVIPVAIVVCFCRRVLSVSLRRAPPGEVLNQETGPTFIALQNTQIVQNNPVQFQTGPYPPGPPPAYSEQDLPTENAQVYVPPPDYTLDTDDEWCDSTDVVTTTV